MVGRPLVLGCGGLAATATEEVEAKANEEEVEAEAEVKVEVEAVEAVKGPTGSRRMYRQKFSAW